ncbi:hypothetical protein I4U23_010684 [Adineta vaga]|nr:hypothetical protein I4U23_010684 [Adineta vaga]
MKVLLILILIEFDKSNLILQSNIQISDWGKEFQPANPIEFLNSISVKSLIHCAKFCNLNIHCRTFDYDVSTLICRLIEGEVKTGLIIPSISLTSRVGNTNLISNLWYHISYIYDRISLKQSFYLNGKIDGILFPSEIFQSNANQILIGVSPNTINTLNLFAQMNQMIFVSYIKNTSEIIDEATLVVYYRFDNSLIDSSSYQNQNASGINIQFDLNGRFNQALLLNSTYSLFQVTGFYFLGQINYPFTFSIWIYPFTNQGIIIEVRGFDNFWWTPMLGFDSNHYLKAQTWNGGAFYYVTLNSFVLPLNTWTHVTTTFSVDNGLRLFVNGTLVNQTSSYYVHIASGTFNILSIGGCSDPIRWGNSTHSTILPIQYRGKIDEMKIYSRELTIDEVYTLAN